MNNTTNNPVEQDVRKLLGLIQTDFPIVSRPFQILSERIGGTEPDVIHVVRTLIETGTIRAFGPVFEPRKLGYVSTLAAARVDEGALSAVSHIMNTFTEITHAYLRDNAFNLWFTVTALSENRLNAIINTIKSLTGVSTIISLPVKMTFKICAVWNVPESTVNRMYHNSYIPTFTEADKVIIKALQETFPLVEEPFRALADLTGLSESIIMDKVTGWLYNGVIRRFGARLNHTRIGYTDNVLAAWHGEHSERWGEQFAQLHQVSHCYLRETTVEWPYDLFTMLHARSEEEINDCLGKMRNIAPAADMVAMKTLKKLKKTSMKYFMED